jgi:hypothetical protein
MGISAQALDDANRQARRSRQILEKDMLAIVGLDVQALT